MVLSVETKNEINKYLQNLLPDVVKSVNNLHLKEVMEYKNPLVREMFHNSPEEFITFFVIERIERSFVTLMGNMIEKIVEILVKGQGGEIIGIRKDWKPYDLKFKLSDGKEYWLEIKSILNQNNSNKRTIDTHRKNAIQQGKEFRLCIYYRTNINTSHNYILIGKDFWSFIGGDSQTESIVFELIKDAGQEFSFMKLIQEKTEKLIRDYRNVKTGNY